MKKTSQLGFSIIFVLLAAILMISVYTVVLQRSYGCIAEEAAVARDTKCADVIHQVVSDKFNRNDFQTITTKADMETARYQELQQELNELRRLNSTRYLYTAKRGDDGRLIYLIDGLDLDAEDFAYPGTYIEEEMIPYIDAAMNGQTIYSSEIVDTTWATSSPPAIPWCPATAPGISSGHCVWRWTWRTPMPIWRRAARAALRPPAWRWRCPFCWRGGAI